MRKSKCSLDRGENQTAWDDSNRRRPKPKTVLMVPYVAHSLGIEQFETKNGISGQSCKKEMDAEGSRKLKTEENSERYFYLAFLVTNVRG